jgi:hypothetical protein
MTTQQKANCTKYYNRFFEQNCNLSNIGTLTKNALGQPCFEFQVHEETSGGEIINALTRNNWKVYGSTINRSKFFAVFNN